MIFEDPTDHKVDYVDAYLHGALTPEEVEVFEAHCAQCQICRLALEEGRSQFKLLQALPMVEAPESLIANTNRWIAKRLRRRRVTQWSIGSIAATMIGLIAALHIYYASLRPSPYDLRLLGQNELISGSEASLRVLLVNHNSGRPIPDVPVDIELVDKTTNRPIHLADFRTNQFGSGTPRFRLPEWKDDQYQLRVTAGTGSTPEVIEQPVKLHRSWQLMLSPDKPVYQPGQTIHVRCLSLSRPELKPVAGHDCEFSISDPKGNVIFRRRDVTSRFGIASADCPLADEIIEGSYKIECKLGDTTSATTVEVKKYVLPKFKIDVELDKPYYSPEELVKGTIQTRYFFGKPLESAEATIEAVSAELGRPSLYKQILKTDADGRAAFEFRLPKTLVGLPQRNGDAQLTINISVCDSAGQKQSATVSRLVAKEPIHLEVIYESDPLVPNVANKIYFFSSYPDGRPAETRLKLSGIERELRTNSLGVAEWEYVPKLDSHISWDVVAIDDQGRKGSRVFPLQCDTTSDDFLVRADKAVYNGGETVRVLALSGGSEPVFIDLIKDGQTILTEMIPMTKGRGQFEFDLPPDVFGTLKLCAYRYNSEGYAVRKPRVIYVRQSSEVRIAAALDREEYRPGQRAKLQFQLTDKDGRPRPGALSLSAVDEAVFSVLSQKPGMEKTFFLLEEELLKPVYAIYPWSPDFSSDAPTEDRELLERAIFSRISPPAASYNEQFLEKLFSENMDSGSKQQIREIFSRADIDNLIKNNTSAQELKTMLEGKTSFFSLQTSSFPDKVTAVSQQKEPILKLITTFWTSAMLLGGAIGGITMIYLSIRAIIAAGCGGTVGCLLSLLTLVILGSLMVTAYGPIQDSSRQKAAMAELGLLKTAYSKTKMDMEWADKQSAANTNTTSIRVRQWFPETLLWRPELITDDRGRASLDVDLADSITTWRLSASAVTAEGELGAEQSSIRVFQPFFVDLNLPVALTRGDEVTVPAVVYNYLDKSQTVELKLADADWFERPEESTKTLTLAAGEVASVGFRLKVAKVGRHQLQVDARAGEAADSIRRDIEVVPDGRPVEQVTSGTLQQPAEVELSVPSAAVEGSPRAIVKLYPSTFSQVVEGLDAIFQRPYGCFEQTSSTTYPNVLALSYLERIKKNSPDVEAKARQYIHLGYQRLLSFEVSGGGFDWFGRPPANLVLTAYGLMEFEDMSRVHDVDPRLIERTRKWLLDKRKSDGSWAANGHTLHDDPTGKRGDNDPALGTTAYVAWAVYGNHPNEADSQQTRNYLLFRKPSSIRDPYLLALVCNALLALDPGGNSAKPYIDQLEALKKSSSDDKLAWWDGATSGTLFYGSGRGGGVETTALAALAMLRANENPATARGALGWLIAQKDSLGTWYTTQATVLALKALLTGAGKSLSKPQVRKIDVLLDGATIRTVEISADQSDVVRQIDLTSLAGAGNHKLRLIERTDTATGYQVALKYHLPSPSAKPEQPALGIELAYDRANLAVDETLIATARLTNNTQAAMPMVIVDLPIPAGFVVEAQAFDALVSSGRIAKYQLTPRSAILYLISLPEGKTIEFDYRLRATMPVKITAQPAQAYEYYNPDRKAASGPASLTVRDK
jgi:alpha-2-macroglobulin-like protein